MFGGNSAAAPIVTSVVAYLLSNYSQVTSENIKSILVNNSEVIKQQKQEVKIINVKKIINNLPEKD